MYNVRFYWGKSTIFVLFARELEIVNAEEGGAEDEELGDKDEDGGVNLALWRKEEAEKSKDNGGDRILL